MSSRPGVRVPSKLDRTLTRSDTHRTTSTACGSNEYQIDLEIVAAAGVGTPPTAKLSRKEVIQPQVLLQLPCYDFTPITNHTFGTCLPCGLARRLLVQPAFVM